MVYKIISYTTRKSKNNLYSIKLFVSLQCEFFDYFAHRKADRKRKQQPEAARKRLQPEARKTAHQQRSAADADGKQQKQQQTEAHQHTGSSSAEDAARKR